MEAIFDLIASSPLVMAGVIGVFVVLAGLFFSRKIIQDKKLSRVAGAVAAGVAVLIIAFLAFGGYGPAIEFVAMKTNGKELALIETHQQGSDEDGGTPTTVNRLYVVDGSNGQRIVRQLTDYTELLAVTPNGVVVFGGSAAKLFDLHSGDLLKTWSKYTGFEKYPELSSGVSAVKRAVDFQLHPLDYLSVTGNNGNEYYFDVVEEKLYPGTAPQNPPSTEVFRFKKESGEIRKLVRGESSRPAQTFSGTFLKPEIVAQDDIGRFIVVRHFATLDQQNALLTAISYDLQQLWQIEQQALGLPGLDVVLYTDGHVYATFGGTVICIDASNGKQIWKTQL